MPIKRLLPLTISFILFFLLLSGIHFAHADRVDELRAHIENKNKDIQEIEREIAEYEKQLHVVGAEKSTLQNAIETLDITRRKILRDIDLTQEKINETNLTIEKLNLEIQEKESRILQNRDALEITIRRIDASDRQTLVETILAYDSLSEFWSDADTLGQFQSTLQEDLTELQLLRELRLQQKTELEVEENELRTFRSGLTEQKSVVEENKKEKDELLDVTENKESNFERLLAEKKAKRAEFERDLRAFEEALKIEIDPNSIPGARSGILAWPINAPIITQYFGNTPFASANPQVYSGGGHNGIDLGISTGTPIKSALSGTIVGTGNTDLQSGCYSYGKWVLVEHANGLSTLYAHLSVISASEGQQVATGDIIGYSGNTGYSTGPHLHFTVYATQGVQIVRLGDVKEITNCGNVSIPVADPKAYLNPLSYLSEL